MENYFEESFGGPPAPKNISIQPSETTGIQPVQKQLDEQVDGANGAESEPAVEFSASEKVITCDEEDTLLEVAEQVGVAIPSGCRMGSCGACKHQLAAGEVCYDVEPRGLSEGDRATGHVLTCVAKPVGRVVLAL